MKPERDWGQWSTRLIISTQGYIIKNRLNGKPTPLHGIVGEFDKYRRPKTPIFKIDMFGIKPKGDQIGD